MSILPLPGFTTSLSDLTALANQSDFATGGAFEESATSTRRVDFKGSASVAVSAGADGTVGTTFSGTLAAQLAAAIKDYTRVDPATGVRQLKTGMADFAATDIAAALNQAGFSADQANTAAKSLVDELARGGTGLSASFSAAFNSQTGPAGPGGSNGVVIFGLQAYAIVGTLSATIAVDSTGQLSVSLERHTIEAQRASVTVVDAEIDSDIASFQRVGYAQFGKIDPAFHDPKAVVNAGLTESEALTQTEQGSDAMAAVPKQSGALFLLGAAGTLASGSLTAAQSASDLLSQAADQVDPSLRIALAGLKRVADQAATQNAQGQGTGGGADYNPALASVIVGVRYRLGLGVADAAGYGSYGYVHGGVGVSFSINPVSLSA